MTDGVTTEYTPTTDEIRAGWVQGAAFASEDEATWARMMTPWDFGEGVDSQGDRLLRSAFDRWLAAHDRELSERRWDEGYQKGLGTQYGTATPTGKPYDPDRIAELEAKIAAALSCLDSFSWHEHDEGFVKWTRKRLTATGQEGSNGDHV